MNIFRPGTRYIVADPGTNPLDEPILESQRKKKTWLIWGGLWLLVLIISLIWAIVASRPKPVEAAQIIFDTQIPTGTSTVTPTPTVTATSTQLATELPVWIGSPTATHTPIIQTRVVEVTRVVTQVVSVRVTAVVERVIERYFPQTVVVMQTVVVTATPTETPTPEDTEPVETIEPTEDIPTEDPTGTPTGTTIPDA